MGAKGELRGGILLVAGDAGNRDALVEVLEGYGYEVALARDGDEALEYLGTQHPCLILLDVATSHTASYELLTSLKAEPRLARLPVILLTGTADASAFRHFSGAVLCLSKPVEASTLHKVVGVYCRQLTPAPVAPDRA
jgi:CheY-like chemotaxis protein